TEQLYERSESLRLAEAGAAEALDALREGASLEDIADRLRRRELGLPEVVEVASNGEEDADPAAEDAEEETEDEDAPTSPYLPSAQETSFFSRTGTPIHGPFDVSPLVRQVFSLTMDSPVPDEPIRLGDPRVGAELVVYKLIEREEATREDF